MKVWKRCVAAVLAFMTFTTSVNFSEAAGIYDIDNFKWTSSEAEVVAEKYELEEEALDVLYNKAINGGEEYDLLAPYDSGIDGKTDLIAVDYREHVLYAKILNTDGYAWIPQKAVLNVDGQMQEEIFLSAKISHYNDVEYDASGAFTYDGNSYSICVTYDLELPISNEEQTRILQIPVILAKTAKIMEEDLLDVGTDVRKLGDMLPGLKKLQNMTYTVETMQPVTVSEQIEVTNQTEKNEISEQGNSEDPLKEENIQTENVVVLGEDANENMQNQEMELVEVTVPLLDPEKCSDIISSINALHQEYKDNGDSLILYTMSEDYRENYGRQPLTYALDKGRKTFDQSVVLFEYVEILLDNFQQLRAAINKVNDIDPELYEQLSTLQRTLKNLLGTAAKPGELSNLADEENWLILSVEKSDIFASDDFYTQEDFWALEDAVCRMTDYEQSITETSENSILAAQIPVHCNITYYNVDVVMSAQAVSGGIEDDSYVDLENRYVSLTLLEGSTREEILQAIKDTGVEEEALAIWNRIDYDALGPADIPNSLDVNIINYDREVNHIPDELHKDIQCEIKYSPKYFKVKTDFYGNIKVPYGYKIMLPVYGHEDTEYTYIETDEAGRKIDWYEGVQYEVTKNATLSQKVVSKEKVEYRVYDLLINDGQYTLDSEAKQILTSSAIASPTLNIKMPDASLVGKVEFADGVYSIHAQRFAAGVSEMYWEPDCAKVMKNNELVQEVPFNGETASWNNGDFTYVDVSYKLNINRVKGYWFTRPYEEEDVLEAINLPHTLVTETVEANEVLCGDRDVTVKSAYEEFQSLMYKLENNSMMPMTLKQALGLISSELETKDGINAVRSLLQTDEYGGGWNVAQDELALYCLMQQCEATNWSLAAFYQSGICRRTQIQTALLRDCLTDITQDPGFINAMVPENYKQMLRDLIPLVSTLASDVKDPHAGLYTSDVNFPTLINQLLALEGKTSAVEKEDAKIFAYTSVRRNGANTGTIDVVVDVEGKLPQTKCISYDLEGTEEDGKRYHILTESEAETISEYVDELEVNLGMKGEEAIYFNRRENLPVAGEKVYENTQAMVQYLAKEYYVTVAGVSTEEYCEVFKYNSDLLIKLLPYSDDPEYKDAYYLYTVNGEVIKSHNGYGQYYGFFKEDLATLFDDQGHYEISRELVELNPVFVDITATENMSEDIRAYYADWNNRVLLVDANPKGLKETAFKESFAFDGRAEAKIENLLVYNENRDPSKNSYISNGSYIEFKITDKNGEEYHEQCQIILLGDVNKDGMVDGTDADKVIRVFFEYDMYSDDGEELAADINLNGYYCDSNDVLKLIQKFESWNDTGDNAYLSSI